MIETLEQACVKAQRDYKTSATPARHGRANPLGDARREVFALAIRRGVTYRRLANTVGLSLGSLHILLAKNDTARPDPFKEPVSTARRKDRDESA